MSEKVTENSDYFRERVWYIINTIQANQLFVHSSVLTIKYGVKITPKKATKRKTSKPKMKVETKHLPEILTICVLNALVPNSAMLLVGGHGGGKTSIVKYLGRMFTGKSLGDIEEAIVRAHPQLTEEKLIATLKISKLMQGEEQVIWRTFARAFWKIVDEVAGLGYQGANADKLVVIGPSMSSDNLGFIFPNGSELVELVNGAIADLAQSGVLGELNQKYFGPECPPM